MPELKYFGDDTTKGYVSTSDAARLASCTQTHIGRICRNGEVQCLRVGREWYIAKESLDTYLSNLAQRKEVRAEELRRERQQEYQQALAKKTPVEEPVVTTPPPTPVTVQLRKNILPPLSRNAIAVALLFLTLTASAIGIGTGALPIFSSDSHSQSLAAVSTSETGNAFTNALHTVGNFLTQSLFKLFGFKPDEPAPLPQKTSTPVAVAPSSVSTSSAPTRTVVVQQTVAPRQVTEEITQYVTLSGVSESLLADRLNQLENKLKSIFYQAVGNPVPYATPPSSGGFANNIALLNIIDHLDNVVLNNPTIIGGSISGTSGIGSVSTGGLTASSTIADFLDYIAVGRTATTTIRGETNATSTFAGGISAASLSIANLSGCDTIDTDANGQLKCGTDLTGSGAGTPGGANNQVQFNNNGDFGGDAGFTYSSSTDLVTVTNASTTKLSASYASSTQGFFGSLNIGSLSGLLRATAGVVATATIDLVNDVGSSILTAANGGTGWANLQANSILLGNGTGRVATTSAGTNGQVLALVDGVPTWTATSTLATISGTLGTTQGGTNITSYTTGDTLYASASNVLSKLAIGTGGQVLAVVGGIPSWVATTTLSTISGALNLATQVTGDLPFANLTQIAGNSILGNISGATGDVAAIATSSLYTGTNGQVLARVNGTWVGVATTTAGTGLTYDGTSFNANCVAITGSADLCDGNDATGGGGSSIGESFALVNGALAPTTTVGIIVSASSTFAGNVTITGNSTTTNATTTNLKVSNQLTLGLATQALAVDAFGKVYGFATSTLSTISGALDLATQVGTSILAVANGGTGWANLQANTLLLGNGTGRVSTTTAGTNGQVLALVDGVPTWTATSTLATITGTLAVNQGGTGATTFTNNRLLTGNGTGALVDETNLTFDGSLLTITGNASSTQLTTTGGAYLATTGGNVGIGTTSPGSKLEVSSARTASVTGLTISTVGTGNANDTLSLLFRMPGGASSVFDRAQISSVLTNASGNSAGLAFYTSATNGTLAETVRFEGNGTVGIGTTTPQFALSVSSSTASQLALSAGAGIAQWAFRNAGGNLYLATTTVAGTATSSIAALTINGTTGNVGLGTDFPSSRLSVLDRGGTGERTIAGFGSNNTLDLFTISYNSNTGTTTLRGSQFGDFELTALADNDILLNPYGSGRVGIGTTTPGTLFSLGNTGANTINISATATSTFGSGLNIRTGCFAINGTCVGGSSFSNTIANGGTATTTFYNGGLVFYNSTLGTLSQASAQSGLFYDNTNSRLGIGTTSPYRALSVSGNAVFAGANQQIEIIGATISNGAWALQNVDSDERFRIFDTQNGAERVTISSTGNVGIGTSTPLAKLDVYATDVNGIRSISTVALGSTSGGGIFAQNNASSTAADQRLGGLFFGTNVDGTSYSNAGITGYSSEAWTTAARGSHLRFETAGLGASSRTERMRITADGNVGIGTTTPTWLLNPSSATAPQLALSAGAGIAQWVFRNAGGNLYFATTTVAGNATTTATALSLIGSTGYLGIGTTSPQRPLQIENGNPVAVFYDTDNVMSETRPAWFAGAVGANFQIGTTSDFSTYSGLLNLNGTNGYVGIGTTTPGSLLSLSGSSAEIQVLSTVLNRSARFGVIDGANTIVDNLGGGWTILKASGLAALSVTGGGVSIGSYAGATASPANGMIVSGSVGIGTSTPWRKFSITDPVSTAQTAIAYDTANVSQLLTSSVGDLFIYPSGSDAFVNDGNLWVCSGGTAGTSGCPTGSPSGNGNLVVETAIGLASSTPWAGFSIASGTAMVVAENRIGTSTSMTINWRNGNQQLIRIGTAATTISFSGYIEGQKLVLTVCNPAAGTAGTITWGTQVLWPAGTAPTQTTTVNKCDVWSFLATNATSSLKIFGAQNANF